MPKVKVSLRRLGIFGYAKVEFEVEGTLEEIKILLPKELSI